MKPTNLQLTLFELAKQKTPSNISFIEEISGILNISYDSAYRRIKGVKKLTIDELDKICTFYHLSLDSLIHGNKPNHIFFRKQVIQPNKKSFEQWLNAIVNDLNYISGQKEREIIYAAKDPPIWYHWNIPDIATFKIFFWQKTLLQIPEYADKKFSFEENDRHLLEIGKKMLRLAVKIPSTELWNEDTFYILLKQIEYYWVSGIFKTKKDVYRLCEGLERWVRHIEKQAELGFKFIAGEEQEGMKNNFYFYENEVVLNDNTILVKMVNKSRCYLTFNTLNLLIAEDVDFIDSIDTYFQQIKKKSILISDCSSKERHRFFNKLINAIDVLKKKVETNI